MLFFLSCTKENIRPNQSLMEMFLTVCAWFLCPDLCKSVLGEQTQVLNFGHFFGPLTDSDTEIKHTHCLKQFVAKKEKRKLSLPAYLSAHRIFDLAPICSTTLPFSLALYSTTLNLISFVGEL